MKLLDTQEIALRQGTSRLPEVFIFDEQQKWFDSIDFSLKENLLVTTDRYLIDKDLSPSELMNELSFLPDIDPILFLNIINAAWILDRQLTNLFYIKRLKRIFSIKLEPIIEKTDTKVICFKFKITTNQSVIKYHQGQNKIFVLKKIEVLK